MKKADFSDEYYLDENGQLQKKQTFVQTSLFAAKQMEEQKKTKSFSHIAEMSEEKTDICEPTKKTFNPKHIKKAHIEKLGYSCFWENERFYIVLAIEKKLIKCYNSNSKEIYSRDTPKLNYYSEIYLGTSDFITF